MIALDESAARARHVAEILRMTRASLFVDRPTVNQATGPVRRSDARDPDKLLETTVTTSSS